MLFWLADHAYLFYFVFGAAALVWLSAAWTTRRTKYWGFAAASVSLILLTWLLTKFVVTDRQQIVLNLDAMARATEQQKPDDVFKHVSKNFRYGPLDRDELFRRIRAAVQVYKVHDIHLWDQQIKQQGDVAEAIFNFRADAKSERLVAASARAKFVREDGSWKLIELETYKLGTTERQFIPGID